jgi:sulfatase maturation enzyme AslB (radical SAM superfamily)
VATYYEPGNPPHRELFSLDLRITYRCNQNCIFCGVDKMVSLNMRDRVIEAIGRAAEGKTPWLNLSGGEPVLDPDLPEYIGLAKSGGIRQVTLMTNAVLLADEAKCCKLKAAGLDRVFVSLHAPNAELSDRITRSPGGFGRTVEGVKNLLKTEIQTGLIFVLCSENAGSLAEYVRFVSENFGRTPVFCSYATPYYEPIIAANIVPKYSESVPAMREAFRLASELGVAISFMEEQHSIPECVLPGRSGYFRNLFAPILKNSLAGFIKRENCFSCRENENCAGVKNYYARLHGLDEFTPITG